MKSLYRLFGNPSVLGLILSILLTLAAYFAVVQHLFAKKVLIFAIMGLGFTQAAVQLVLFLHLGDESRPKWNLIIFLFMLLVAVIVVFGSLWIMNNLDYNVMPQMNMEEY